MRYDERFTDLADRISEAVGKWWFTTLSLVFLVAWVGYGALILSGDWFTSNRWNFPLNTITTVGEWFLEGLVLAAANRAERRNQQLLNLIHGIVRHEQTDLDTIREELDNGPHPAAEHPRCAE